MDTKDSEIENLLHKTFVEAINALENGYQGSSLTDIFITVDKEAGEVAFYDDEENRMSEIVIFDWVDSQNSLKDSTVIGLLRNVTNKLNDEAAFDSLEIYKPFSVNYSDDNFEVVEELLHINDESTVEMEMDNSLMEKFDREFDDFLEKLLKD